MKNFKKPQQPKQENTFTNLTPRRGSLPIDYNRPSPKTPKFPLSSPTTPQSTSPTHLNFNSFSPILEDFEETGEILEGLLSKGRNNSSNKLLNQLLEQKERLLTEKEQEIKRLEVEKTQLLSEKETWTKTQLKVQQLEKNLLHQNKKIEELKSEIRETGEDLLQAEEKNDEFKTFLAQERLNNRQLEQRLNREMDENDWLRGSFKQTKSELSEKVNELSQLKKITQTEKEQWQKVFSEREEKYEEEKKEREEKFALQINNLRTFQINTDTPLPMGRGRSLTHKRIYSTNSLPVSRNNSPRGSTLFLELNKAGYSNPPLTGSPLRNDDTDPLEEAVGQAFDDLMSEVGDFAEEKVNQQGLEIEIWQLKNQLTQSETAYQILSEEHNKEIKGLRELNQQQLQELQDFDKKEVIWREKELKMSEELAELKYKLAETQKKVQGLEKNKQKTSYQLKQEIKKNKELMEQREQYLNDLETETDKWDSAIQESQDLFAQLEAKTETTNHQINHLIKK